MIIGLLAWESTLQNLGNSLAAGKYGGSVTGTYLSELRSDDSVFMQEHNKRIFTKHYYF